MAKEKLCVYCKNMDLDMGEHHYSNLTPGSDAIIRCTKGHWEMGNLETRADFVKNISKAKTCADLEEG